MTAAMVNINQKDAFEELSEEKKRAVELYALGWQVRFIADALEVSTATIRNWKNDPVFRTALADAINLKAETSNYKLHNLWRQSLETCEELMKHSNPGIRLGAARLAAESYTTMVRAAEDKALLDRMEERMAELQANMSTAGPILEEAEDVELLPLPEADS